MLRVRKTTAMLVVLVPHERVHTIKSELKCKIIWQMLRVRETTAMLVVLVHSVKSELNL
jgi:hypothetical protein